MGFVLDASMVAAWLMPDEQTPETDALLDLLRETPALAPDLLRHEIRSLFLAAVKRQRAREFFALGDGTFQPAAAPAFGAWR
jgi:predicted nucleic acid-binding protein